MGQTAGFVAGSWIVRQSPSVTLPSEGQKEPDQGADQTS